MDSTIKCVEVHKYDDFNNEVYYKDRSGKEEWWTYDKNGNATYCKDSEGGEFWFDTNGNIIKSTQNHIAY